MDRPTARRAWETPRSPSRSTRNNLALPRIADAASDMPSVSPRRRTKPQNTFSDRYIPNRTGVDLQAAFSLSQEAVASDPRRGFSADAASGRASSLPSGQGSSAAGGSAVPATVAGDNDIEIRKEEEANKTFSTILKAELFGDHVPTTAVTASGGGGDAPPRSGRITPPRSTRGGLGGLSGSAQASAAVTASGGDSHGGSGRHSNLFTFQSPSKSRPVSRDLQSELYSLSPVHPDSQKLLLSPQKKPRTISKVPYRVLDAPELSDDFYLNLVDWGSQDTLAVGLGDSVYLWDGATQSVDRLCNLAQKDKVTSLNWIGSGTHLAIGTSKGLVEIWDATKIKCVRTMSGHNLRVSSLAWNEHILSSGSRDRSILNRDVRVAEHYVNRFEAHKQEVCGLKWNVEENKLASGGNDNKLFVWDGLNPQPLHSFTEHTAAVKAIAWSPHQRGLLASGGGTVDKTIKTWNTLTGTMLQNVNTGSQVCNLAWSKNSNELVSTHGYSRNQVVIWKYPSMQQVASLTGHTYRVLYLALSPDGETIVTGAGDETLRFWNVFEKNRNQQPPTSVLLDAFSQLR
ncbi:Anaphase-promoting complex subunit 4-like WD40 domain-containing protein [[Candida] zeylanoides]